MSIKRITFETALHGVAPASLYAFTVWIDGLINSNLLAVATTYPAMEQGSVVVPLMGKSFEIPTTLKMSGDWACTFIETQTFMVKWEMVKLMLKQSNEHKLITVDIRPLQAGGVMPMAGIRLGGCYMKSKGSPRLDMANATEVWRWDASFHYNWIEETYNVDDVPLVSDAKVLATLTAGKLLSNVL